MPWERNDIADAPYERISKKTVNHQYQPRYTRTTLPLPRARSHAQLPCRAASCSTAQQHIVFFDLKQDSYRSVKQLLIGNKIYVNLNLSVTRIILKITQAGAKALYTCPSKPCPWPPIEALLDKANVSGLLLRR
jgi:hypothetical protein